MFWIIQSQSPTIIFANEMELMEYLVSSQSVCYSVDCSTNIFLVGTEEGTKCVECHCVNGVDLDPLNSVHRYHQPLTKAV